jgi:hypothetical protein
VTPRGRYIYLDVESYLEEAQMEPDQDNAAPGRAPTNETEDDNDDSTNGN